jgi:hypothetical protein
VAVNPYVFIVGCPRSETSLLQRIVDAHPDIAVVFEMHWISRWLEKRRGDYNFDTSAKATVSKRTTCAGSITV